MSIGPVAVDYRRPNLRRTAQPTTHGTLPVSITGLVEDAAVDTLSELVLNPFARVTVDGFTGVQEWLIFSGALAGRTGYYILQTFDDTVEHSMMFTGFTGFTLTAAYLGALA